MCASNANEVRGKKGWDRFKELVEQENNNHKDYENTLAEDEDTDQIRIDRIHYELVSSQQQEKENGEGHENENNDQHWGMPSFDV